MARVLIATDGSDFSIDAARRALPLLGKDMDITVLSVTPLPLSGTMIAGPEGAGFAPAPANNREMEEVVERESYENVDRTVRALGITAQTRVERGDPRLVICQIAEKEKFDLVVVGSHGAGLLRRVLLGSVSHHVVHHCPCPVMMMRARGGQSGAQ